MWGGEGGVDCGGGGIGVDCGVDCSGACGAVAAVAIGAWRAVAKAVVLAVMAARGEGRRGGWDEQGRLPPLPPRGELK